MTIKVAESNQPFRIDASFSLLTNTSLEIEFTRPDSTTFILTDSTTPAVTAPNVALVNDPELGNVPAGEYFEVLSITTTFDQAGSGWTACGKFIDTATTPDTELFADLVEFEIRAQCSQP